MRDVGVIRSDSTPATALTAVQARQLRAYLTYDDHAISRDLRDYVDMMLATSLRIGEPPPFTGQTSISTLEP